MGSAPMMSEFVSEKRQVEKGPQDKRLAAVAATLLIPPRHRRGFAVWRITGRFGISPAVSPSVRFSSPIAGLAGRRGRSSSLFRGSLNRYAKSGSTAASSRSN